MRARRGPGARVATARAQWPRRSGRGARPRPRGRGSGIHGGPKSPPRPGGPPRAGEDGYGTQPPGPRGPPPPAPIAPRARPASDGGPGAAWAPRRRSPRPATPRGVRRVPARAPAEVGPSPPRRKPQPLPKAPIQRLRHSSPRPAPRTARPPLSDRPGPAAPRRPLGAPSLRHKSGHVACAPAGAAWRRPGGYRPVFRGALPARSPPGPPRRGDGRGLAPLQLRCRAGRRARPSGGPTRPARARARRGIPRRCRPCRCLPHARRHSACSVLGLATRRAPQAARSQRQRRRQQRRPPARARHACVVHLPPHGSCGQPRQPGASPSSGRQPPGEAAP
jgi:hypothetical protein